MEFIKKKFIIKSNPIRKNISENKLNEVIEHINNGYDDGLTEQEVKTLLDWIVEETRKNLEKYLKKSIKEETLLGLCGIAQCLSLTPLIKCGFNVTVNNISSIMFDSFFHAFGTCTFPVRDKNGIVEKRYLIDVTFRQFFTTQGCKKKNKDIVEKKFHRAPDPGYYIDCKFPTQNLLQHGYTEIDDNKLIMYVKSFAYSVYDSNIAGKKVSEEQQFYDKNIKIHNYCVNDCITTILNENFTQFNPDDLEQIESHDLGIQIPGLDIKCKHL